MAADFALPVDPAPIRVTLAVATTATLVLLVVAVPLAWWLARGRSRLRPALEVVFTLPMVLPPTVLGFYLLWTLGPEGPIGALWEGLGGPRLVFSFSGIVIGSILYSTPFVLLPLVGAFRQMGDRPLEVAATLRAAPLDRFLHVALPIVRPSLVTAAVLGFAHTVGEFGVVLMIGGNIPGETQVLSIALFERVELLDYRSAHVLAGGLLVFAVLVLAAVRALEARARRRLS